MKRGPFKTEFYKSLWGFENVALGELLPRIRGAGYVGIECPLWQQPNNLKEERLAYVAQGFPADLEEFKRDLELASRADAVLLNLQAGRDYWSEQKAGAFLEGACQLAEESPCPVAFETHRGRLFFSAASSHFWLKRFPSIRLTADFSHWVCVSESLLEDQGDALALAIERTLYVHARVGHEEGPQVPDPRSSRWSRQLEAFENWWRRIAAALDERGEVLRINPEYGPPNYMPVDPEGDRPLTDLWEVCLWTKDRLETEYRET